MCSACNKSIDSTTQTEREGQLYCKACYGKNFGPKGAKIFSFLIVCLTMGID